MSMNDTACYVLTRDSKGYGVTQKIRMPKEIPVASINKRLVAISGNESTILMVIQAADVVYIQALRKRDGKYLFLDRGLTLKAKEVANISNVVLDYEGRRFSIELHKCGIDHTVIGVIKEGKWLGREIVLPGRLTPNGLKFVSIPYYDIQEDKNGYKFLVEETDDVITLKQLGSWKEKTFIPPSTVSATSFTFDSQECRTLFIDPHTNELKLSTHLFESGHVTWNVTALNGPKFDRQYQESLVFGGHGTVAAILYENLEHQSVVDFITLTDTAQYVIQGTRDCKSMFTPHHPGDIIYQSLGFSGNGQLAMIAFHRLRGMNHRTRYTIVERDSDNHFGVTSSSLLTDTPRYSPWSISVSHTGNVMAVI